MSRKPIPTPRTDARTPKTARQTAPVGDRKIHFLLTDAYLAAANTGRPLTQLGLNALCKISRSVNDAMQGSGGNGADKPAEPGQLETIRERWLDAFEQSPDHISPNAAREAELAAALTDSMFFQLMQNANDAAAALLPNGRAMMLGRNGRGFRSVLSVTDQPRVHSGDVRFTFDPRQAHKAVKKRLGRETPQDIPVLRLPFACAVKDEPLAIRGLIDEYDTVIVIPFRSLRACERCRAGCDKAVNDMSLLKRLPAINLMIWERDDATAQYKRTIRDNVDRTVKPAPSVQRRPRVEVTVGDPEAASRPDAGTKNPAPAAQRLAVTPRTRRRRKTSVSASIVRHPKDAKASKRTNGKAGSAAQMTAKSRGTTNGASSSNSKPTIKKSATTARVSVSEKGAKPAARKPAAKKPTQKAAATHTKTKKAKAPAARKSSTRKPAAKRPTQKAAARKPAATKRAAKKPAAQSKSAGKTKTASTRKPAATAKKPAQKSAAAKTKTSKTAAARKAAAKKPATKKPAAQGKPAGKTKTASTRKPATRKAPAKPRNARAKATKTPSKSKASAKKA